MVWNTIAISVRIAVVSLTIAISIDLVRVVDERAVVTCVAPVVDA